MDPSKSLVMPPINRDIGYGMLIESTRFYVHIRLGNQKMDPFGVENGLEFAKMRCPILNARKQQRSFSVGQTTTRIEIRMYMNSKRYGS